MHTAKEIADWVQGIVVGDEKLTVDGMAYMHEAGPSQLTFVRTSKDLREMERTKAQVILVPPLLSLPKGKTYIKVTGYPEEVLHLVTCRFSPADFTLISSTVHPSACVDDRASIGKGVHIGARSFIHPNVTILDGAIIGEDCILYPQTVIGARTHIGNRVVIHSGAAIGNDSFEFVQHGRTYRKIPNLGCVILEDEVEIGANTTIDRGTIGNTIIRKGTKIDNLVQIGHEVEIGENCILAAQVGVSGWTKIGRNTTIYGQSGIVGEIIIGDHVVIMGKSVVTKDVPDHQVISGNPALPHQENLRFHARLARKYGHSAKNRKG